MNFYAAASLNYLL